MHRDVRDTPRRRVGALLGCLLALGLAACGSTPPSRFYVLAPLVSPLGSSDVSLVVGLEPVVLPTSVDRAQMVTRVDTHRRRVSELDRWAEPLGDNVTRVVGQNLEALLGPGSVAVLPQRYTPDLDATVAIQVIAFEAVPEGPCTLVSRVQVADGEGHWLASRVVRTTETGTSEGAASVAEAMSANLRALSEEVLAILLDLPTPDDG